MNDTNHERARKLVLTSAIEDLAPNDRAWLDSHLAACAECASQAGTLTTAVESLRGFHPMASPELLNRTRTAVRIRAQQLQAARARAIPLWIATAISSLCMIFTMPYVWRSFAWFGRIAHLPDAAWQVGFLMWWFLPATVLAAAAAWRHSKDQALNWGQR